MRRLIPQSAYARNVLTLMTGTTVAQAIPIAISAVLFILFFTQSLAAFLVDIVLVSWLYLVPFSVLLLGLPQSFNCWSKYKAPCKHLAICRTLQNRSVSLVQPADSFTSIRNSISLSHQPFAVDAGLHMLMVDAEAHRVMSLPMSADLSLVDQQTVIDALAASLVRATY